MFIFTLTLFRHLCLDTSFIFKCIRNMIKIFTQTFISIGMTADAKQLPPISVLIWIQQYRCNPHILSTIV